MRTSTRAAPQGTAGDDVIHLGDGNDDFTDNISGNDTVCSGNGNGTLDGGPDTDECLQGEVLIDCEADLSVAKVDSPDPAIASGAMLYTVTVTNAGPSDAEDVVVTDTLPAGITPILTSGCAEDLSGGVPNRVDELRSALGLQTRGSGAGW